MIYFIQENASHLIKIGFTAGDGASRAKSLQTGNPDTLTVLAEIPGTMEDEKKLHSQFKADRVAGEWFKPSPKLIGHILRSKQPEPTATKILKSPYTFYLAGKIEQVDWRKSILGFDHWPDKPYQDENEDCWKILPSWPIMKGQVLGKHNYCGPFFIAAKHFTFDGDDSHGCAANRQFKTHDERSLDGDDLDEISSRRESVLRNCEESIRKCDILFAWIDSLDCFGTIAEIGYAKSLGKMIWITGPRRFRDLWFVYQMANQTLFVADLGAKTVLSNMISHFDAGMYRKD